MNRKPNTTLADAVNVALPYEGLSAATSTTEALLDLTPYIGKYVTVTAETENLYVSAAPATGAAPTIVTGNAATPTPYVGFPVNVGSPASFVVPKGLPRLVFRTLANTGRIRVHRS